MAGAIRIHKPNGREVLSDPFYYLNNFQVVVSSLEERYQDLLSTEERQFIAQFGSLPKTSRALLVRMVMREGAIFRCKRLNYLEIGETSLAVAPLLEAGWVEEGPALDVNQLQRLLTKTELLRYFALSRPYHKLKKAGIVALLRARYPESKPVRAWCRESTEPVYRLVVDALCERFRLMFFGNFHQDWSEFVLRDLGIFAYERIPAAMQSLPFLTRVHIDAFHRLYRCRRWLDEGVALDKVVEAIPHAMDDCDWLEDRRQKLLFQIAGAYERRGEATAALAGYSTCTYRGARMRTIRLRARAHEWEMARELSVIAQQNPENEAERHQLRRLLPRLNKRLGLPHREACDSPCLSSFEMNVDAANNDCKVEYYVRDRLAQETEANTTVHYVENGLVNSLFGLLCWTAIFAPIRGAFFHDFQQGPADLASDHFHRRRHREFAGCFAELESDRYKATIRQRFIAKAGIQCPFIGWKLLNKRLLDSALTCFPAAHLRLWFEWILGDIRENRAGFPDLVQFWPQEQRYRMIEVKGPGDRLQDNQRRLLEFCTYHRMPVSICYVRRSADGEEALNGSSSAGRDARQSPRWPHGRRRRSFD
ncbi:MAG: hypothetical protein JWN43_2089 [Gammaproteobacteria bacterium]|nr:hypothetical protein [Gammaproteobacteria bacterium]